MKPILRNLLLTAFFIATLLFTATTSFAQLEIDDSPTPLELAESLIGEGVSISGVTMDCPSGASGFFECLDCNVGIANGILLTSGDVYSANGPNNSGSTGTGHGAPGDADLNMIPGVVGTNDACVLEFDLTVTSDTIRFNYVFGSEEYIEYVNFINDVFAFYISGPGIVGTENLALIPGTDTEVSINNVNHILNTEYFVDNGDGTVPPYNSDDFYIQYDGFTTVLEAKRQVIPCETYHLKIAIADDADYVWDSGVFIEAGSLSSPGVNLVYETEIDGYPYIIEGCNEGSLSFELSFAPIDTFEIVISVGGTAIAVTDYEMQTLLTFLPGDTLIEIPIIAPEDGIDEGIETIVVTIEAGCITGLDDSLVLYIYDAIPVAISPDTIICPGTDAVLVASGGETYSWTPEATLSDPSASTTVASPTEETTYTVTSTLASCINTASTTVSIQESSAYAGEDTTIYFGESAFLEATGGVEYTWLPILTLSNPDIADPLATPGVTTVYTVYVTTAIGCEFTDQVTVNVSSDALVGVPNAFSPNGDGFNDGFTVIVRGQLASYNLQIFNRWGEQVFESTNFTNSWKGIYNNEEQPLGSYTYYLTYKDMNGQDFTKMGSLTLVR
ncbi:MAG: choice-of-anchor L domain-containing protein [Chitinophagales bacterium]|jgi:gliding motility-associated-like protein|nr:choice-of-anchor L domain-containing protein [Bacteroidota bacterium]MBK9555716.1 choice-of-anchor L domain-containing protein [Bacteroidota bacterium]MBL0280623.1 choice-of-anchor L domain-containing protein [Bacteroidota bacterium]MBP8248562.1 choice-of-anchor L domain-containing protein [Chitinophagales bacterium]MBP9879701.1 choice-of-anchor L domain-containing protein [Chitinophagales bacterium]